MAFEQLRQRVQLERKEQAIGLGQIEPALEGASGRLPLAECVPGARLDQKGRYQPRLMGWRGLVAEEGRERGRRRLRVVLREQQRRRRGADGGPFAFLVARRGQGRAGLSGLPQPCEDVHQERAYLGGERVRFDQRTPRQALRGEQGRQRRPGPAAADLEKAPDQMEQHPGQRLDPGLEAPFPLREPEFRRLRFSPPDQRAGQRRIGDRDHRVAAPAVSPRQLDRLRAALRRQRERAETRGQAPVGQPADLQEGASEPTREGGALLKVRFSVADA
jgi:hypothetical protein